MAQSGNFEQDYLDRSAATRDKRMKWWREARFGMFIHWGLYSQLARHEWVMHKERIPIPEYEQLAKTWKPTPDAPREWARLARKAGMKYMVLTTKHHEGYLLWDSKMSDYNAVKTAPGRDLVAEYVDACRAEGLKVGFYYSLMDWHHPDGMRCAGDEAARRRFVDYTYGCVEELMSNYGKVDILWYDVSRPLNSAHAWESYRINDMARRRQPHLLINNRAMIDEDFGTPEEHVTPEKLGRDWEACMTFNGSWGWQPCPQEDWLSVRDVLKMLRTCTAGAGNLLLNIGPKPDGSVPPEAVDRLTAVGKWLDKYGPAVYGKVDRVISLQNLPTGSWTRKGNKYYYWITRHPGKELAIGGLTSSLTSARLFGAGEKLPFEQVKDRLILRGLPKASPDRIAQVALLELQFRSMPSMDSGWGQATTISPYEQFMTRWHSPFVKKWQLSRLMPKDGDVSSAKPVSLSDPLDWRPIVADNQPEAFMNVHAVYGEQDGIAYLANRFAVEKAGTWTLHLGHDGGAKVFVDGRDVLTVPERRNPAAPGRSAVTVDLTEGEHEVAIAFDTHGGWGWGVIFVWEMPKSARPKGAQPWFPKAVNAAAT